MKLFYFYIFSIFCFQLVAQNISNNEINDISGKLFSNMSQAYAKENWDNHKKYADTLLDHANKYNLEEVKVGAIMNQGIYYTNVYQYENALEKYLIALKIGEKLENEKPKITVLVNLVNLYNIIEDYPKAIQKANETIELAQKYKGGQKIILASYNAIAISYSHLNQPNKSLEYIKKVKESAQKMNDSLSIIIALNNMGDYYNQLKEYDKAIGVSKQSLILNKKIGFEKGKSLSFLNIGLANLRTNKIDSALYYLNIAKVIAQKNKINDREIHLQKLLAEVYEKKGEYEKSLNAQKSHQKLKDSDETKKITAAKNEIKEEVKNKGEQIIELKNSNNLIYKKKVFYYRLVILLLLLFVGLFVFSFFKRKEHKLQTLILREDYTRLTRQNYSLKEQLKEFALSKENSDNETKYKNSTLNYEIRQNLMNAILNFMENEKPFLDHDFSPLVMAKHLSISNNNLSEILNVCFEKNFYNFINIYRIKEAQRLLQDSKFDNYKMETLGYESGFKSKTTFNRVFKQLVGITPTEYREKTQYNK